MNELVAGPNTLQIGTSGNTADPIANIDIILQGAGGVVNPSGAAAAPPPAATATNTPVPATPTPTQSPANTPTPTPTAAPPQSVPTSTPLPAQGSGTTPVAQMSFFTTAVGAPSSIGANTSVAAYVSSVTDANVIVDLEVYNQAGAKVYQVAWTNQSLVGGQTRGYGWMFPRNAPSGTYTIKIGIFSLDWLTLYNWNDTATNVTL